MYDAAATDDVAIRQRRMDDARLQAGGASAEAPAGEVTARRQRARMAIRVKIVAVSSRSPVTVQAQSDDRGARAAIEDMSLDEFANLGPDQLTDLAADLESIVTKGGGR
jgi:hypothetical protein